MEHLEWDFFDDFLVNGMFNLRLATLQIMGCGRWCGTTRTLGG
jgi:hypothetical protein